MRRAPSVEVLFGALPSWPTLLVGARALEPMLPEWCWEELSVTRVWTRHPITAAMCAEMARFILKHFPPPPDSE